MKQINKRLLGLVLVLVMAFTALPISALAQEPGAGNSITGIVWNDADDNGVMDEGENPVPGIEIGLYAADDLLEPVALATSGSDGIYVFEGVEPADYVAGIVNAGEYIAAFSSGQNDNKLLDTGFTEAFSVLEDSSIANLNLALVEPVEQTQQLTEQNAAIATAQNEIVTFDALDTLIPVYITQDGTADAAYTPVISAAEFTDLLNQNHVNTPDTIYTLLEDITIDAADLRYDYFSGPKIVNNFLFYGSIEGNNNTITVDTTNLASGELARPLFMEFGSFFLYPRNINERYAAKQYVQNLTVHYTGDVAGTTFAQGNVYNTWFTNVHTKVDGDIVPVRFYTIESDTFNSKLAAGFAYRIDGMADETLGINCALKNITVTANNIGDDASVPESGLPTYQISGFANHIGVGVDLTDITVNYKSMQMRTSDTSNNALNISGFANWMFSKPAGSGPLPVVENLHVNVTNDIHVVFEQYAFLGYGYTGIYGISRQMATLKNSSVTVGGSLIVETLDTAKPAGTITRDAAMIMGIGAIDYNLQPNTATPQFQNNTVSVGGDIIARSHGNNYIMLGIVNFDASQVYRSENTEVTVGGDVIAERIGWPLDNNIKADSLVYGPAYALTSSENDTLFIQGEVIVKQTGGNTNGAAGFTAHSGATGSTTNGEVKIGGDVTVYSETGNAAVYGFYDSDDSIALMDLFNNAFSVVGDILVQTESPSHTAVFNGFLYGVGGKTNTNPRSIDDNRVEFGGSITVGSPKNAYVSGFGYSLSAPAQVNGNSLYVGGDVTATVDGDSETVGNYAIVSGFAHNMLGTAENNTMHFEGDIVQQSTANAEFAGFVNADGDTSVFHKNTVRIDGAVSVDSSSVEATHGIYTGGFALAANGAYSGNAVFIKDGVTTTLTEGASASEEMSGAFALSAEAGSAVNENTVIGKPGVAALYKNFVAEVDPTADVQGNFFTSAWGGQRVSNELEYDDANSVFKPVDSVNAQQRLTVSTENAFNANPTYLTENNVTDSLVLWGPSAANATLDTAGTLLADSHPAALTLGHTQNGFTAVKDLPGIAHPYEANVVAGTVYRDDSNTGSTTSPLGGATVTLKLGTTTVATATTNAQGEYSIPVPLQSCVELPLNYTIEIAAPSADYVLGTATANDFKTTGKVTTTLGYAGDYTYNGYFAKTTNNNTYTITEEYYGPNGSVAKSRSVAVNQGATYSATPQTISGYTYAGYTVNGGAQQSGNPKITNVQANQTVRMIYAVQYYSVRIEVVDESGKSIANRQHDWNEVAAWNTSFSVTPPAILDYEYQAWKLNGTQQGGYPSITSVQAGATITLVYKQKPSDQRENYTFVKKPNSTAVEAGATVDYAFSGFGNNWGAPLDRFTIMDKPNVGLDFVSASLPAFTKGTGVTYSVYYYTKNGGTTPYTLATGISAANPYKFSAPSLASGDYITMISIEFGKVPVGFAVGDSLQMTFRVWNSPPAQTLTNIGILSYKVNGENKEFATGGNSGSVTIGGQFSVPRTGDTSNAVLWAVMMGGMFVATTALAVFKRRKKTSAQ